MQEEDTEYNEVVNELPEEDYNAPFRANEHTPFQPPTTSKHSLKISPKRFKEIFGHE